MKYCFYEMQPDVIRRHLNPPNIWYGLDSVEGYVIKESGDFLD